MSKFTVGQTVICIVPFDPRPNGEDSGGGGWVRGKKFNISRIDTIGENLVPILWPIDGSSGIYEDWVKLVETEWDEERNK